jgi:Transcriptional regulator containing GAF, AAA-type ATPase, and DNA binding domains
MPPLREMKEDIPLLAQYFLSSFASELGRGSMHFSSGAMECLVNYSWSGNVRELENEVKRAAVLADDDVIDESHLSENLRSVVQRSPVSGRGALQYAPAEEETQSLKDAVEEFEIHFIREVLERNRGNKLKTSKILGLTRQGLE